MTVRHAVALLLSLALVATPAMGQSHGWAPVRCDLKPGHYLVNSGVLYLKNASETRFDDQKAKDLRDGQRVLLQALTTGNQSENPAAWYYLGRYYQIVTDYRGADSAFTKAAALAPACKDDINFWRRQMWTPVFNRGVQAFNAGQIDSAIAAFRLANEILTTEPQAMNALATLYANSGQVDSAAKYYGLAADAAASDPVKFATARREALYNRGAVLHQAQRWDEALAAFRAYNAAYPGDAQAVAGMASAYSAKGMVDSATALYTELLGRADSLLPDQLFAAGVALYNSTPPQPDTAVAAPACRAELGRQRPPLTARVIATRCQQRMRDLFRQHDSLSAGTYRLAAQSFEKGLERNPWFRDALFNLANTYLVLDDSARLLPTAQRLVAADPLNRNVLRLVAAGWQLRKQPDSTLHYLAASDSLLQAEVSVTAFSPEDQTAALKGIVTNLHDRPLPGFSLTFEFLDAKGAVVATQPVAVPDLAPGGIQGFETKATGTGIAAWRYKRS